MGKLSAREREVLILKSSGLTGKEIANKLGLSRQTVKNISSSTYQKLGVSGNHHKTTSALLNALKSGIVRLYEIRLRRVNREDY